MIFQAPNPVTALPALAFLVALSAMLGWVSPFVIAGITPLFLLAAVFEPQVALEERLQKILITLTVIPLGLAGFLAPFRATATVVHEFWPAFRPDLFFRLVQRPEIAAWFDLLVGACGVFMALGGGTVSVLSLSEQARQVKNLPRSTARGAALGLAEFRGVARPIEEKDLRETQLKRRRGEALRGRVGVSNETILFSARTIGGDLREEEWNRFYLEDDTGRIVVDPKGAEFWEGHGSPFWESPRKILLTRARQTDTKAASAGVSARFLLPGEPVYLIGSVEVDRAAPKGSQDTARLVVRPSTDFKRTPFWKRLLLREGSFVRGSEYRHIFFLADSPESSAYDILRKSLRQVWLFGAIWLGSSLGLVWLALRRAL